MKFKVVLFLLFFGFVVNAFPQNKILSIEDALKITKMKNMEEASAFLTQYGYTESIDGFYYREVATFWVKDCEVAHGIGLIEATKVNNKFSSTVSVLAGSHYAGNYIKIDVFNIKSKEKLLKQMKSLGFKCVKKDHDDIIYIKDTDTIEVRSEDIYSLLYIDSLGKKVPVYYHLSPEGEKVPSMFDKHQIDLIPSEFSENGFILQKKNKNKYIYTKDTKKLCFIIEPYMKDIWEGYYEFTIFHNNTWGKESFIDDFYPDNSDKEIPDIPEEEIPNDDDPPISFPADELPEYPGGLEYLNEWIQNNLVYPEGVKTNNIEGTVEVKFTINKDGRVSDAKIVKGIHPTLDQEALKINNMFKWKPGKICMVPINWYYTISIDFKKNEKPQMVGLTQDDEMVCSKILMCWVKPSLYYPADAKKLRIEGDVVLDFIVGKDGSIQDAKIIKGVCKSIDEEALRVINTIPKEFLYSNQVEGHYTLTIEFKLPE